jgi:hypothetical protein
VLPPTSGHLALSRLLDRLRGEPRQAATGPTDLAAALERVAALARRRGVVLVVSDFVAEPGWQAALGRLAVRHEVVAVRVGDPRERELPDIGLVTFEDPETGRQLTVDTSDATLRARFRAAAAAADDAVIAALGRRGVDLLTLGTEAEILPALVAFLANRRRARALGPRRPPTG